MNYNYSRESWFSDVFNVNNIIGALVVIVIFCCVASLIYDAAHPNVSTMNIMVVDKQLVQTYNNGSDYFLELSDGRVLETDKRIYATILTNTLYFVQVRQNADMPFVTNVIRDATKVRAERTER